MDGGGDEVFRDLVVARVVEPTSMLDVARVLEEMGRLAASYSTMHRTLRRAALAEGSYRDQMRHSLYATMGVGASH